MKHWRINTDSEKNENIRTCDIWYKYGMAFTGDHMGNKGNHTAVFKKISIGDGVFMHHRGLGIVGYGVVKNGWDEGIYEGDDRLLYVKRQHQEIYEYRISIDWDVDCDCRKNPLPINGRLPYRGTYCEVDTEKYNIKSILDDLRIRASL
jgi:hypothetical protein